MIKKLNELVSGDIVAFYCPVAKEDGKVVCEWIYLPFSHWKRIEEWDYTEGKLKVLGYEIHLKYDCDDKVQLSRWVFSEEELKKDVTTWKTPEPEEYELRLDANGELLLELNKKNEGK